MSDNERRLSPRKTLVVPLRFRVTTSASNETLKGQTMNLSDDGILFTCEQDFIIGTPLEMSFSLPNELTGLVAEEVRCRGRVVHVQRGLVRNGNTAVGVRIERYEPVGAPSKWAS